MFFKALMLRMCVCTPSYPFIFFTVCFLFIVRGALEHIPACIGLKGGRQLGQAASLSQSPIIHFEPREGGARESGAGRHAKDTHRKVQKPKPTLRVLSMQSERREGQVQDLLIQSGSFLSSEDLGESVQSTMKINTHHMHRSVIV